MRAVAMESRLAISFACASCVAAPPAAALLDVLEICAIVTGPLSRVLHAFSVL